MIALIFTAGVTEAASNNDAALLKLAKHPMMARVLIQQVAMDYLYIGNEVAVTKAKRELAQSLKRFQAHQKHVREALNDPKIKNLMAFIDMNFDELQATLKEPYSLDNAAVVIDLAEAIAEGEMKIAQAIKSKVKTQTVAFGGARYDIAQIGKYYMAYQAGLKDDITVAQMRKTVEHFQKTLKAMSEFPKNTPDMNRIMNRIAKEWKIVHQFYLDIEDGGLPLIVYQTTHKIARGLERYSKALLKLSDDKGQ
jgi:hypothetical protein